jgi:hypothetical protein
MPQILAQRRAARRIGLIVAAKAERLEHDDQRGKTPGELREEIVEGNGKCEVAAMNLRGHYR